MGFALISIPYNSRTQIDYHQNIWIFKVFSLSCFYIKAYWWEFFLADWLNDFTNWWFWDFNDVFNHPMPSNDKWRQLKTLWRTLRSCRNSVRGRKLYQLWELWLKSCPLLYVTHHWKALSIPFNMLPPWILHRIWNLRNRLLTSPEAHWSWLFQPFHWILHDSKLFVIDVHHKMPISPFPTLLDHFHPTHRLILWH